MIGIIKKAWNYPNAQEFIRFCVVGVLCTIIDATIFYIVRTCASYPIALIAGYCLSLGVNYLLTIFWTFSAKPSVSNAVGVISAHLFNLFIVRMGLMCLFTDIMCINDRISYIPTLIISAITNFIILKYIIYKLK